MDTVVPQLWNGCDDSLGTSVTTEVYRKRDLLYSERDGMPRHWEMTEEIIVFQKEAEPVSRYLVLS